jgi:DNA-binding transcriptional MerR regulator
MMPLKMKELVELTQESKSTILYYLKEGLLPQPQKPKPNVHLYDEVCIDIIKFIKYLQHNFSYSISEIKHIFENNNFSFDGGFDSMVSSLELINGGKEISLISYETLLQQTQISKKMLDEYIQKGYIYKRGDGFSTKEIEIILLLQQAKNRGLDMKLFDEYVKCAKTLAKLENKLFENMLDNQEKNSESQYELIFDIVLKLKPYIFNIHTIQTHHDIIKERV